MSEEAKSLDDWIATIEDLRRKPINRLRRGLWAPIRAMRNRRQDVILAWQRVIRGWDNTVIWSLDTHLCRTLGEQLREMAEVMHGHPEQIPFDEWKAAHLVAANSLLAYAHGRDDASNDEFKALHVGAKAALIWVADNLPSLWD